MACAVFFPPELPIRPFATDKSPYSLPEIPVELLESSEFRHFCFGLLSFLRTRQTLRMRSPLRFVGQPPVRPVARMLRFCTMACRLSAFSLCCCNRSGTKIAQSSDLLHDIRTATF